MLQKMNMGLLPQRTSSTVPNKTLAGGLIDSVAQAQEIKLYPRE